MCCGVIRFKLVKHRGYQRRVWTVVGRRHNDDIKGRVIFGDTVALVKVVCTRRRYITWTCTTYPGATKGMIPYLKAKRIRRLTRPALTPGMRTRIVPKVRRAIYGQHALTNRVPNNQHFRESGRPGRDRRRVVNGNARNADTSQGTPLMAENVYTSGP